MAMKETQLPVTAFLSGPLGRARRLHEKEQ